MERARAPTDTQQKPIQPEAAATISNAQVTSAAASLAETPLPALSLKQNFSWTFVGNGVYQACQWGMLIVLAKLTSPEAVGLFALCLAVTAPVIMFSNLSLATVQATDARREYDFGHYLGLRLLMTGFALLMILIMAVAGYRDRGTAVILAMGIAKAVESISDVYHGLLQQRERLDRVAQALMLKGPLSLLTLAVGVYLTGDVLWGVVGLALAWIVVLLCYDLRSARLVLSPAASVVGAAMCPLWDWQRLLQLGKLTLPLGVAVMLLSLNVNIPRYFIEHHQGTGPLGIFAALAYFVVAGMAIIGAIAQAARPRLARHYATGRMGSFRRLTGVLLFAVALVGAGGIAIAASLGRPILAFAYGDEYAAHANVLVWLMIGACLKYVRFLLGTVVTAMRLFHWYSIVNIATTGLCLLLSALLIPQYGLLGAAWALLLIEPLAIAAFSIRIVLDAQQTPPRHLDSTPETEALGQ